MLDAAATRHIVNTAQGIGQMCLLDFFLSFSVQDTRVQSPLVRKTNKQGWLAMQFQYPPMQRSSLAKMDEVTTAAKKGNTTGYFWR